MRPLWSLCGAVLLATGPAVAQVAPPEESGHMLEFELTEGRQVVATPSVRVQVGRPAAIAAGGYSMRLRMDRAAAPGAGGAYVIRSQLYRSEGWTLVATPAVTVNEGEQARLRFTGSDGSDMTLAVLVR